MRLPCLVLTSLLLSVAPALAQPTRAADVQKMAKDDCARARAASKTCVLTIDDADELEGQLPTAGDGAVSILAWGRSASLVKLRRDFIPEILRTAEDL